MDFLLLFCLLFRPIGIFTGFTFTDAIDFGPLATLIIGLLYAWFVCRSRQQWGSPVLQGLMLLLSTWPVLSQLTLFFLAREFQAVKGHWPRVMLNDPHQLLGHVSPLFDALYHLVNYIEALSGAWMVVFFTLFFAAKDKFTIAQRRFYLCLVFFWFVIASCAFGSIFDWWLD